jgi:hypothetical protein
LTADLGVRKLQFFDGRNIQKLVSEEWISQGSLLANFDEEGPLAVMLPAISPVISLGGF